LKKTFILFVTLAGKEGIERNNEKTSSAFQLGYWLEIRLTKALNQIARNQGFSRASVLQIMNLLKLLDQDAGLSGRIE
jgi:hypothetical protein